MGQGQMTNHLDMDFGHELIDHGTSDDYYTPPYVFKALNVEFDLDVSAPPGGVPWIPAKRSLTIIDDGLASEWVGRVWCNPPYSNVTPWAKKLIKHNNGIALVPTAKSAWFNLIWDHADGATPLNPNLHFVRSDGSLARILMPVMLFAFGETNRQVLINSGLGRVR
jgi:hypothetical protein